MNCFRHPNEVAAVFCKGCGKPLCWSCCERTIGNETHVCSEECARTVSQQPDSKEPHDSLFDKVYAAVFLTVLLAALGGGLCVWGAQSAIASQEYYRRTGWVEPRRERDNLFKIFYTLGITDWRAQFGIGAAVGAGCAVLYLKKSGRKAGK